MFRQRNRSAHDAGPLRCSFCHKKQEGGRLISSPGDYPRAYICDECIAVCSTILNDDSAEGDTDDLHPLLSHPLAPEVMDCIERWIARETAGEDAVEELSRLREVARRMIQP